MMVLFKQKDTNQNQQKKDNRVCLGGSQRPSFYYPIQWTPSCLLLLACQGVTVTVLGALPPEKGHLNFGVHTMQAWLTDGPLALWLHSGPPPSLESRLIWLPCGSNPWVVFLPWPTLLLSHLRNLTYPGACWTVTYLLVQTVKCLWVGGRHHEPQRQAHHSEHPRV